YRGAGTVEFIADASKGLRADAFWFMEMNTRLQVEHPVTEAITGTDLVQWQLRVAAGEKLPLAQKDIPLNGHAVEVRLYAEDPAKKFFPSTGRLIRLRAPKDAGVRANMGVEEGDEVSMFYDPMIGKIIAHGETRDAALARLGHYLKGMEVAGPKTNLAFLAAVMDHEAFRKADIDTGFIDRHLDALVPSAKLTADALGAALIGHVLTRARAARAAQAKTSDPWSPWAATDEWVIGGHRTETMKFIVNGEAFAVAATPLGRACHFIHEGRSHIASGSLGEGGEMAVTVDGCRVKAAFVATAQGFAVIREGVVTEFMMPDPLDVDVASEADTGALKAPMPGKIVQVLAAAGAKVRKGAALIVMEAMKMEQTLAAAADGVIASVNVAAGDQVEAGAALVVFEEKAEA
ncbi:MAG TPA: biotin/lipoyl-containing protein, partial [Parvibaculum sp.]